MSLGIKPRSWFTAAALLATAVWLSGPLSVWAVHPETFTHQTEDDYSEGHFDNTVVNNFGELTLGRQVKPVITQPAFEFVNAFAQTADGTIFFSTSPEGKVYKIQDGKAVEYFKPPEENNQILALAADAKGNLLVAACGQSGRLLRLTAGADGRAKAETIFQNDAVQYIWKIRPAPDGSIYLATGPNGQVWKLDAAGKSSSVLSIKAGNILSLILDKNGNIYAGSDGNGLVIRIDPQGKPFVLLDAGVADVSALAMDAQGNIYAATAAPAQARPDVPQLSDDSSKPEKPQPDMNDNMGPDDQLLPEKAPNPKAPGNANFDNQADLPPQIQALIKKTQAAAKAQKSAQGIPGSGSGSASQEAPPHVPHLPQAGAASNQPSEGGSALYKISPDGQCQSLFQDSDMLLSLEYHDDELLIGTGGEGKVYSFQTQTQAKTLAARLRNEDILNIFTAADGTVYLGTSNAGQVYTLSGKTADHGTYTSNALDAANFADWGAQFLEAAVPDGASAAISTRSGNVEDVGKNGDLWSDWSPEIPAGRNVKISDPPARFIQYRVTLKEGPKGALPVVDQVRIAYQVRNLPPQLTNLAVNMDDNNLGKSSGPGDNAADDATNAGNSKPTHAVHITWDATDPNNDDLIFRILYRPEGTEIWVQAAKDIKDHNYTWNTAVIPDGRYQIQVVASDAPDNPPDQAKSVARVSPPVTVDNTPPEISTLKAVVNEKSEITITGIAKDALSPVVDVRIQVDSQATWQMATADDKIFDSPTEAFTAVTRALGAGDHRIVVRATDKFGNASYQAVIASVKEK